MQGVDAPGDHGARGHKARLPRITTLELVSAQRFTALIPRINHVGVDAVSAHRVDVQFVAQCQVFALKCYVVTLSVRERIFDRANTTNTVLSRQIGRTVIVCDQCPALLDPVTQ